MPTVALKQLPYPPTPDGYNYYDQIVFSPGTPPPRPTPPDNPFPPRPTHPIALPGDPWWGNDPWLPHPSHPIALPGDPWWGTSPPKPPTTPGPGMSAVVIPLPPSTPPVPPPEGMPAGSVQVLIWFGKGTQPALAWVAPYASTGPVEPPTAPAPEPQA